MVYHDRGGLGSVHRHPVGCRISFAAVSSSSLVLSGSQLVRKRFLCSSALLCWFGWLLGPWNFLCPSFPVLLFQTARGKKNSDLFLACRMHKVFDSCTSHTIRTLGTENQWFFSELWSSLKKSLTMLLREKFKYLGRHLWAVAFSPQCKDLLGGFGTGCQAVLHDGRLPLLLPAFL